MKVLKSRKCHITLKCYNDKKNHTSAYVQVLKSIIFNNNININVVIKTENAKRINPRPSFSVNDDLGVDVIAIRFIPPKVFITIENTKGNTIN